MKVTGPAGPNTVPLRPAAKRGRSDDRFSVPADAEAGAAQGPVASGAANAIDALLALQEVPAAEADGRRAVRIGHDLLDQLEQVRLGLLTGAIPRERLEQLARLAREARPKAIDPRLAEILGEIELRAEVELAKLGL